MKEICQPGTDIPINNADKSNRRLLQRRNIQRGKSTDSATNQKADGGNNYIAHVEKPTGDAQIKTRTKPGKNWKTAQEICHRGNDTLMKTLTRNDNYRSKNIRWEKVRRTHSYWDTRSRE